MRGIRAHLSIMSNKYPPQPEGRGWYLFDMIESEARIPRKQNEIFVLSFITIQQLQKAKMSLLSVIRMSVFNYSRLIFCRQGFETSTSCWFLILFCFDLDLTLNWWSFPNSYTAWKTTGNTPGEYNRRILNKLHRTKIARGTLPGNIMLYPPAVFWAREKGGEHFRGI